MRLFENNYSSFVRLIHSLIHSFLYEPDELSTQRAVEVSILVLPAEAAVAAIVVF